MASILDGVNIIKDAVDITQFFQPVFLSSPTNSVVLKTEFIYRQNDVTSTITPEGSYTIKIAVPDSLAPELTYWVVPYADDHRLDMKWRVSPPAPRVNQPLSPTVNLSWRGKPLTNANVEARIIKPGDDLGDLLARYPQKVDPLNKPDAGSPGYQKYLHLLKNDPKFLAKLRPSEYRLTLVHQGGGKYSASYNPGDVSGVYQIIYQVAAESPEFGRIQRKAVQSVYTRFGDVSLDKSALSSIIKDNTVTIHFRPVTSYDRFIGPAQGSAFSVKADGIKLSSITDYQDGSYTIVLTGDPDAWGSLMLLGEEIYQGPFSEIEKRRRKL
jgi:hypothetical protein